MAHLFLSINIYFVCYLDSGCYRHITGSREYLIDYVESRRGSVTYGDRVKNKVMERDILNIEGIPKLTMCYM